MTTNSSSALIIQSGCWHGSAHQVVLIILRPGCWQIPLSIDEVLFHDAACQTHFTLVATECVAIILVFDCSIFVATRFDHIFSFCCHSLGVCFMLKQYTCSVVPRPLPRKKGLVLVHVHNIGYLYLNILLLWTPKNLGYYMHLSTRSLFEKGW